MPIDTFVKPIDIAKTPKLDDAIKQECDIQSGKNPPLRLVEAFVVHNHVILIFQNSNE